METTNKSTFIQHYREIPQWLEQSPVTFSLLALFARRARREAGEIGWSGESIYLKPKQFISGRKSVSYQLGITEGEYRGACKKLIRHGYIKTIKVTNRYTIYLYCADGIFFINASSDLPPELPPNLPSDNHQSTTNNNGNNDKKITSNNNEQPMAVKKLIRDEINKENQSYPLITGNTPEDEEMAKIAEEIFGLPEDASIDWWHKHAVRIAEILGFNPEGDKEWFGFFKKVYEKGQEVFLEEAAVYCENSIEDVDDIRKVFFHHFHELVKESKE